MLRMESGNFSAAKSLHGGLFELRLAFGPGYRVYFAKDGENIVLLLGGGSKRCQQADIEMAKQLWQSYKQSRGK
jgi:putative addiction module killer protein